MSPEEIMEAARRAAGNTPSWSQNPATITLTLADGQQFQWKDVSLSGVASLLVLLGRP